jgi:hypothetical protein
MMGVGAILLHHALADCSWFARDGESNLKRGDSGGAPLRNIRQDKLWI